MALRKRTDAYWERRSNERLSRSEQTTEAYMKKIRKVYADSQRVLLNQVRDLYEKAWSKEQGFDKQYLRLPANSRGMKHLVSQLKKLGLYEQLPDAYRGRLSRLEYLNAQIWMESKKVGLDQEKLETEAHRKVYEDSYYRSAYDVSRGIGSTPQSFSALDKQTLDGVMNTAFQGKNYSERIWSNTDILASQLQNKLAVAISTGQGISKTARDIRERYGVSQYYAERLVRTESNYFHNQAELDSYQSMGFEYYEFLATLDNRTSEICAELDGKKFKVTEAKAGVNAPPLHPNCRSTLVPYFKDYEPETRMYRNPETGKNEYTYNMEYNEWRDKFTYALDSLPVVKDGLSVYKKKYTKQYDEMTPIKPPKDIFEKQMPNTVKNKYGEKLTNAEIDLIKRAESLGYKVDLIHNDPRVPTKDFKMFGANWELKTPTTVSDMIIRNTINKATDQGKRYVMLDVTYFNESMSWVFNKIKTHISIKKNARKVDGLMVVRGNKFIRYK